jgi:hypothetical protein
MTRTGVLALALWAVFAALAFSVIFDFHTRVAAIDFMAAQYQRRITGAPLETIEHGFRPLVQQAARQAAPWPILIFAIGTGATLIAGRHSRWPS